MKNERLRAASVSCIYIVLMRSLLRLIIPMFNTSGAVPDVVFTGSISVITLLPPIMLFRLKYKNDAGKTEKKGLLYTAALSVSAFMVCIGVNMLISRFGSYTYSIPPYDIPFAVLCMAVIPAVLEEMLFRDSFICVGMLISSLLFGLVHSGAAGAVFAFLCGTVLFIVRICTGSLAASITVHLLNNLTALAFSFFEISIGGLYALLMAAAGISGMFLLLFRNKNSLSGRLFFRMDAPEPFFISFLILAALMMLA